MGVLLFIIFAGIVFWLVKKGMEQNALNQASRDAFNAKHAGWDIYVAPFDQVVVALNHDRRAIVLGTTTKYREYPWAGMSSVEILKDGTSITSTNRGSQVVG